jgi:hypothetical protein
MISLYNDAAMEAEDVEASTTAIKGSEMVCCLSSIIVYHSSEM